MNESRFPLPSTAVADELLRLGNRPSNRTRSALLTFDRAKLRELCVDLYDVGAEKPARHWWRRERFAVAKCDSKGYDEIRLRFCRQQDG